MEAVRNAVRYPVKGAKRPQLLSASRIVLLVVAAAAPLAAIVGNMPIALALPGGLGIPAAFLATVLVLLCFATGYAAMSREVVSTGAFYTYVGQGLGKDAAVVAAFVALMGYGAMAVGLSAAFGYFASLLFGQLGAAVPWLACAAAGIALIGVMGFRSIDVSARVLTVLISAEFAILAVFDVLVVVQHGWAAFPLQVWAPSNVLTLGIGSAIPFAVSSFVGFESAALYGEDSSDPVRTIGRATYASLIAIGVFYLVTVWIMIGAAGPANVQAMAQAESGNFLFHLTDLAGGPALTTLTGAFFVTSVLASFLALHNAISRYLFAVARDGLLPGWLAAYHPDHHSPHRASVLMSFVEAGVVGCLGLLGFEPYLGIASGALGFGTIGILLLQLGAAFAIFAYLRRKRLAPAAAWLSLAGGIGLSGGLVMTVLNYSKLTGSENAYVNGLPWAFLAIILAALVTARVVRARNPAAYRKVARSTPRPVTVRSAAVVADYKERYCIVGAGPAGLIMARALLNEGVPFDCFERHSDVGGVWDPANNGSPMYESAHFISSKWTSYFYGFPMPDSYPDYPSHRQILAYIRSFARAYGLYEHVTFNTSVTGAERDGTAWTVQLSSGERRQYAGIVCAPGPNWHPRMPSLPGMDSFKGEVRHSVTYRSTEEFRGRRVLIVGGGNSGVDIACDAARAADHAFLSLRRGYRFVPKHMFGIPTDVLFAGQVPPPRGVSLSSDTNVMLDTVNGDMARLGLLQPDHDALSSHPVMNTQVLHYLAHGDITAKPDIQALSGGDVVFVDGSREAIDLVLLSTGYEFRLPFLSGNLFGREVGNAQLYLNLIHREADGLYVIGMSEFASAGYRRFDEMAQIVVADIHARATGVGRSRMQERRQLRPDLTGGKSYVASPRHANYVEIETYCGLMAEIRREFGWPDLDDSSYDALRVVQKAPTSDVLQFSAQRNAA